MARPSLPPARATRLWAAFLLALVVSVAAALSSPLTARADEGDVWVAVSWNTTPDSTVPAGTPVYGEGSIRYSYTGNEGSVRVSPGAKVLLPQPIPPGTEVTITRSFPARWTLMGDETLTESEAYTVSVDGVELGSTRMFTVEASPVVHEVLVESSFSYAPDVRPFTIDLQLRGPGAALLAPGMMFTVNAQVYGGASAEKYTRPFQLAHGRSFTSPYSLGRGSSVALAAQRPADVVVGDKVIKFAEAKFHFEYNTASRGQDQPIAIIVSSDSEQERRATVIFDTMVTSLTGTDIGECTPEGNPAPTPTPVPTSRPTSTRPGLPDTGLR